jgi:hypothetical protein
MVLVDICYFFFRRHRVTFVLTFFPPLIARVALVRDIATSHVSATSLVRLNAGNLHILLSLPQKLQPLPCR